MSGQPVEPPAATRYPAKTLAAIREALPADQRAAFDKARDHVDLSDLAAVAAFRDKWWGRALAAMDSELAADRIAAMNGELELAEPWPLRGAR
ncbi:hypothetical protein ACFP1Z_03705 [Streptomyces gamaensis]|uniref:Uncharacterized protein n=1 Tax=Streptomyces gamaensis TaxID=1763542 RepID=A0ABW0YS17_9ACTN